MSALFGNRVPLSQTRFAKIEEKPMHAIEEIRRLESDLEHEKEDLREDITRISNKLKATRANLGPTKLVQGRVFLLSGLTLGLGFALGYRGVPVEEIGGPVARSMLATAGKQATIRAIKGR
jgi:hypothetical protein